MTKALLVALNLLFLIAYKLFLSGDLTIDQKVPEQVNAGESFLVEITIDKGDREGFAKWQQTLPEGFIASAKSTSGATFSFKNQELKLIWMAIPEEEVFTISFEVKTDPTIRGEFAFKGQFSFIEDNQRKDVSSEVKTIEVVSESDEDLLATEEGTQDQEEDQADLANETEALELEAENDTTEKEVLAAIDSSEKEVKEELDAENSKIVADENEIKIRRTITPIEAGKHKVSLTINKGSINSFGKVEEYLPPNYIATVGEDQKAMFSFNRNVAKFLWMILPEEEEIEISYYLESTSDELDEAVIHGVFSYLIEDDPMQLKLLPSNFSNTFEETLAEEIQEEEQETPLEDFAEEEKIEEETVVEEVPTDEVKEDLVEEITDIPAPETSVSYKVQIAAGKKEVQQQYFIRRHNIREKVNIEYHESWYKYTIGGFPIYKQARDRRNEVWETNNKIDDAFVTAYNSGERISVQEALMISQQKWYK